MRIGPADALIVVDLQRDFCAGGALAVKDGDLVVPVINALTPKFRHTFFTRDWHPANHCSFSGAPTYQDGSWPAHCVQNTPGAAFHPGLKLLEGGHVVDTAANPNKEGYSGFDDTNLGALLRERGVRRVFVCGLATDYCVKATALDGRNSGFEVVLVEDACRGVDIPPGLAQKAIGEMRNAGVVVCRAEDIV